MNRMRIWAVAAGIGVLVVSAGTALAATGHGAARPAVPAARDRVVMINCSGKAVVRPRSFLLACADANANLTKLQWTSWRPGLASAKGDLTINACIPSCAEGTFYTDRVVLMAWGTGQVPHHPREYRYRHITTVYIGRRPPHIPRTMTWAAG